jgi:hypothetical protein
VAEFDFQKLGSDRFSQNIKRAITNPVGNVVTGDITKGEIVTVGPDFTGNEATATVSPRRTGAIMIARTGTTDTHLRAWYIVDTTLTVTQNNAEETTYTFWVF